MTFAFEKLHSLAAPFLGLAWVVIAAAPGCRGPQGEPTFAVYLTGDEPRILKFLDEGQPTVKDRRFSSVLDHAYAALLTKAFPQADAPVLRMHTAAAICQAFQRQTGRQVPAARREALVQSVAQSGGFEGLLDDLKSRAPAEFDRPGLIEAGLEGLLGGPGKPAAWLVNVEESRELRRSLEARTEPPTEKGLVGLDLTNWPAVKVIPEGPSFAAGLRDGDVLVVIGGKDVSAIRSPADAAEALAGAAGQTVEIQARRGGRTDVFRVQRVSQAALGVRASVVRQRILHLSISTFEGSGVADRVGQLLAPASREAGWTIILDLRNNPGGRLEQANGVASQVLDGNILEILQFRNGRRIAFRAAQGAIKAGIVVLVNRNTGSTAEILAMALRDNGRAVIVGEPTAGMLFGKDIELLEDGRLLVIRTDPVVLSPTGRDYSNGGIPPDILVPDDRGAQDRLLDRAVEYAEQAAGKSKTAPPSGSNEGP